MKAKILIVDDSPTIRSNVKFFLERGPFIVIEACDGREGVKTVRATPDIALVICDVNMPHMNGIEFVTEIRKLIGTRLPIIMLTTEGNAAMIEKAKAAGANAYMVKPFQAEQLTKVVSKITGVS